MPGGLLQFSAFRSRREIRDRRTQIIKSVLRPGGSKKDGDLEAAGGIQDVISTEGKQVRMADVRRIVLCTERPDGIAAGAEAQPAGLYHIASEIKFLQALVELGPEQIFEHELAAKSFAHFRFLRERDQRCADNAVQSREERNVLGVRISESLENVANSCGDDGVPKVEPGQAIIPFDATAGRGRDAFEEPVGDDNVCTPEFKQIMRQPEFDSCRMHVTLRSVMIQGNPSNC